MNKTKIIIVSFVMLFAILTFFNTPILAEEYTVDSPTCTIKILDESGQIISSETEQVDTDLQTPWGYNVYTVYQDRRTSFDFEGAEITVQYRVKVTTYRGPEIDSFQVISYEYGYVVVTSSLSTVVASKISEGYSGEYDGSVPGSSLGIYIGVYVKDTVTGKETTKNVNILID